MTRQLARIGFPSERSDYSIRAKFKELGRTMVWDSGRLVAKQTTEQRVASAAEVAEGAEKSASPYQRRQDPHRRPGHRRHG